jgi:hypothetical protein
MSKQALNRFRISLAVTSMSDADRLALIAGIEKVAPASTLMKVPAIAASYGALLTKGTALQSNNALVAADQQQLRQDETTRDLSRSAADVELITLKTLVAQNATSSSDVAAMGFKELQPVAATTQAPPDVPGPIVVKIGKTSGKARVGIGSPGRLLGSTTAQMSPDPIGPTTWTLMPGAGKERKISGQPSGTRLWVRFAAVKYGQQSGWSTPVLVIIP